MKIFRIPPPFSVETTFHEGDIVFFAAGAAPGSPPFEHVAIVLKAQSAKSAVEVANVQVYALPESVDDGSSPGIREITARDYWIRHKNDGIRELFQQSR